jgi:hypothetical protein
MYLVLGIIFLVVLVLLFKWRVSEFVGEEMFEAYLKQLASRGEVLENVVFDNQTMAPYLFVSKQGIFNIYYNPELTGRLYGRDDDVSWSHVMGHRKMNFLNPVKTMASQRQEINKISDLLEREIPIYEVLCFSKRLVLKINTSREVVYLKDFVTMVNSQEDVLSESDVKQLIAELNN